MTNISFKEFILAGVFGTLVGFAVGTVEGYQIGYLHGYHDYNNNSHLSLNE